MNLQMASRKRNERLKEEAGLDEALEQTFPASDPFSVGRITATEPPSRPADRQAPRLSSPEVTGSGRRKKTPS